MQRIIFLVLLAIASNGAMADWLKIFGDEKLAIYIESTTIRKNGSKVKLWQLIDYSEPQTDYRHYKIFLIDSYLSTKGQFELDCRSEQSREIYFMFQTEPMGSGKTTYASESPQQWIPIVPDSSVQIIWKYACDKKYRATIDAQAKREKVAQQADDQNAATVSGVPPTSTKSLADEWDAIPVSSTVPAKN